MRSTEPAPGGTIVGVGVDIADVTRFDRLVARDDGRVWAHWYTETEAQECLAHRRPGRAAALRFAVKEAAYKAVGAEFSGAVRWGDIEVLDREQGWDVVVRGEVAASAAAAGVDRLHVSTCEFAGRVLATVIAEGRTGRVERAAPARPYAGTRNHHRGQG